MRIPTVLLTMTLLVAGASQAQTTDTAQPASPPSAAVTSDPASAAAGPADPSGARDAETQAASAPPKAPPGFKLEKRRNGAYVYCQEITRLGTRFPEKICFTQDQYDEVERRSQSMRESMQKPVNCTTVDCFGG